MFTALTALGLDSVIIMIIIIIIIITVIIFIIIIVVISCQFHCFLKDI